MIFVSLQTKLLLSSNLYTLHACYYKKIVKENILIYSKSNCTSFVCYHECFGVVLDKFKIFKGTIALHTIVVKGY